MAVQKIIQLGHVGLRDLAQAIVDIQSPATQTLIQDLFDTLASTSGVGIAAPQIAQSWQMMIIASRPTPRYPNAPEMAATLMINPRFLALEATQEKDWEGCLSIPSIRAQVPRYTRIEVSYTNAAGELKNVEFSGFLARVFQHEYDHLQGLVYLDRVESNRDIISEEEFFKLIG